MKRIDAMRARRAAIAGKYRDKLKGIENLRLPPLEVPRRKLSWFVYVVRLSGSFSQTHRDWIMNEMHRRGIGCGRYFAPIHLQPAYGSACGPRADLPVTEFEASRCLALPFFNRLQDEQIDEVCENLSECLHLADSRATQEPAANSAAGFY